MIILTNKMPYFTSWDINVILCLISLGLPGDLLRDWIKKMKKIHEELELKNAMEYHCDRRQFVNMKEIEMLYYTRADLGDPEWHFPKAISKLGSIPAEFHNLYENGPVSKVRHLLHRLLIPGIRKNFKTAFRSGYINRGALEWAEGFHPGRFILMDMNRERERRPIIIRDLYSFGNWCRDVAINSKNTEQNSEYKKSLIEMDINRNGWCIVQFIVKKDHIEDLIS
jgi:hypothetical protein